MAKAISSSTKVVLIAAIFDTFEVRRYESEEMTVWSVKISVVTSIFILKTDTDTHPFFILSKDFPVFVLNDVIITTFY